MWFGGMSSIRPMSYVTRRPPLVRCPRVAEAAWLLLLARTSLPTPTRHAAVPSGSGWALRRGVGGVVGDVTGSGAGGAGGAGCGPDAAFPSPLAAAAAVAELFSKTRSTSPSLGGTTP